MQLERELGGTSGLSVSSVGVGLRAHTMGTLRDEVAWSTIKVPIALAIERQAHGEPSATERSLLARAITASDNAAAEALWADLGDPTSAASAVENVLKASGDSSTRVESRVLRPGFSSSGQTRWTLADQQRFIATLPCMPYSARILALMGKVVPDQRWGLGSLSADAQFKGGWGPEPDGAYLVRQMGIVRLANGRLLAVSVATIPADGSFSSGTANLNAISRWALSHVDSQAVSPAQCRA